MKAKATIAIVAAALLLGLAGGAQAQTFDRDRGVRPAPKQKVQKRAPTRIIVRPILRDDSIRRNFRAATISGTPAATPCGNASPGCATEHRPSGTVVTPQMRCWWQRG